MQLFQFENATDEWNIILLYYLNILFVVRIQ